MIMFTLYHDFDSIPMVVLLEQLRHAAVPPTVSILWNMQGDVRVLPWQCIRDAYQTLMDIRRSKERRLWGTDIPEASILLRRCQTDLFNPSSILTPVKFSTNPSPRGCHSRCDKGGVG